MTNLILITKTLMNLAKRVPPNQRTQFEEFRKKTFEYCKKIESLPDKLPPIDWDYYRRNVRDDFVKTVDEFRVKYEELNRSFAKRHEVLDHSKYYVEWQELEADVKGEVEKFIEDSRDRVKFYEEEIRRLKNLKYENMTMEQFIDLREDFAHTVPGQGKPLFWPHTPEEQFGAKREIYEDEKLENKEEDENHGKQTAKTDSAQSDKKNIKKYDENKDTTGKSSDKTDSK